MTAFGAATGEYVAAIFGSHAGPEAVLVDSFPVAGLKGSFHDGKSILRVERINLVFISLKFQGLGGFSPYIRQVSPESSPPN